MFKLAKNIPVPLFALCCFTIVVFSCNEIKRKISGDDYSITQKHSQSCSSSNINFVELHCYCPDGVIASKSSGNDIILQMKGINESVGYHGKQEVPKEIGTLALDFKSEIRNDTLLLISKEWMFIHHSFIIRNLELQLPEHVSYRHVRIPGNELEGRGQQ